MGVVQSNAMRLIHHRSMTELHLLQNVFKACERFATQERVIATEAIFDTAVHMIRNGIGYEGTPPRAQLSAEEIHAREVRGNRQQELETIVRNVYGNGERMQEALEDHVEYVQRVERVQQDERRGSAMGHRSSNLGAGGRNVGP